MTQRKVYSWTNGAFKATVYRDSEWQEYQVRLSVDGKLQPCATYHCNDINDARCTARTMANSRAADYAVAMAAPDASDVVAPFSALPVGAILRRETGSVFVKLGERAYAKYDVITQKRGFPVHLESVNFEVTVLS